MRKIILLFFCISLFAANIYKPLKEIPYDEDLALIGKRMFFDINLNSSKVSCNTCHDLNLTGSGSNNSGINTDNLLNPPTVLNIAYSNLFFKDASVNNLYEQVEQTLLRDMHLDKNNLDSVLQNNVIYNVLFEKVGLKANTNSAILALVEFEKALVTLDSPFDLFLKGDSLAISERAKNGLKLFNKYGCLACHNGDNFGTNMISSVNNDFFQHCEFSDSEMVKIPTLRNITLTAPYSYNGGYHYLEDIIRAKTACQLGIIMPDKDVDDIIEFLKTLEGKRPKILDKQ